MSIMSEKKSYLELLGALHTLPIEELVEYAQAVKGVLETRSRQEAKPGRKVVVEDKGRICLCVITQRNQKTFSADTRFVKERGKWREGRQNEGWRIPWSMLRLEEWTAPEEYESAPFGKITWTNR